MSGLRAYGSTLTISYLLLVWDYKSRFSHSFDHHNRKARTFAEQVRQRRAAHQFCRVPFLVWPCMLAGRLCLRADSCVEVLGFRISRKNSVLTWVMPLLTACS